MQRNEGFFKARVLDFDIDLEAEVIVEREITGGVFEGEQLTAGNEGGLGVGEGEGERQKGEEEEKERMGQGLHGEQWLLHPWRAQG